jgi:hypothetical protein
MGSQLAKNPHVIYEHNTRTVQTVINQQHLSQLTRQGRLDRSNKKYDQAGKGNDEPDPDLNNQIERFIANLNWALILVQHEAGLSRIKSLYLGISKFSLPDFPIGGNEALACMLFVYCRVNRAAQNVLALRSIYSLAIMALG